MNDHPPNYVEAEALEMDFMAEIPQSIDFPGYMPRHEEAEKDRQRIKDLEAALKDLIPILKAVRFTVGLGKNQLARIEKAEKLLTNDQTT